jgi:PAS domain S-box-containing protein
MHERTDSEWTEGGLSEEPGIAFSLTDFVQDVVLILDVDSTVRYANPAVERLLGYRSRDLRETRILDYVHPEDVEAVSNVLAETLRNPACETHLEFRWRHKDGSWCHVEANVNNSLDNPSVRGVVTTLRDLTERKQTEKDLQWTLDSLLTVYEAGRILGSTLEAEEIGSRLLQLMQRIARCVTAVISVPDNRQQLRVWRAIGLENLWRHARYTPEVRATLHAVMVNGRHTISLLQPPQSDAESVTALFLPLRIRNRSVGVLEVYGPDVATDKDVLDILLNLTTKAASALENAQLYGKLTERERQLEKLVGRLLVTQEEERRRVAYEVHDGPTQVAVAAYQHLQAFATMYPPDTPEGQRSLDKAVELTRRAVRESRQIIEHLRPTVLDDFGLATAIRVQVEQLRTEGWEIGWEENVGNVHIPSPVETALYRVAQEALSNVRKHARTTRVRLRLWRLRRGLRLEIRDWGVGFKLDTLQTSGPGERVGLAGMRERMRLLGGTLRIYSGEGTGTLVVADVPFSEGVADQDTDLVKRLAFTGRSTAVASDG